MAGVSKAIRDSLDELDISITNLKAALRQRRSDESAEIRGYRRETEELDNNAANDVESRDVSELDVGRYGDLKDREVPRDGTQHDHIPSKAALLRWAERYALREGMTLTQAQRRTIEHDGVSVEISDALHRLSRTYGGRQTRILPDGNGGTGRQIDVDADDLDKAMWRDLATLWENTKARSDLDRNDVLDAIEEIIESNRDIESRIVNLLDDLQ